MATAGPSFFATPAQFRAWLRRNHAGTSELWVGFYRKASGRVSITWPESVDEALCYGWIDGLRKSIDQHSYKIRFTPRRATSIWSAINIGRVRKLKREGRMSPAGLRAFKRRLPKQSGVYSYENRRFSKLSDEIETGLRKDPKAWNFFEQQAPSYRQMIAWWVMSAKRPETQWKRLRKLIAASRAGRRL